MSSGAHHALPNLCEAHTAPFGIAERHASHPGQAPIQQIFLEAAHASTMAFNAGPGCWPLPLRSHRSKRMSMHSWRCSSPRANPGQWAKKGRPAHSTPKARYPCRRGRGEWRHRAVSAWCEYTKCDHATPSCTIRLAQQARTERKTQPSSCTGGGCSRRGARGRG